MAYELADKFVGQYAVEIDLVPVFLVHVPCRSDVSMCVTKFDGVVGVALEDEPFGFLQVDHREDFAHDAKGKCGLVEREILGCFRQRQAVFSYAFDVHSDDVDKSKEGRHVGLPASYHLILDCL